MSSLLVRTQREDPVDAEIASDRLLTRAGYVRRTAPGVHAWLPLGLLVLRNVERIVREEMVAIGAQEVLLPALTARDTFERSGRWADYGDALFRLHDRRGADYLLAPTHEEAFTLLAAGQISSYRDLPLRLFQIQAKYRDEARPRAGVLRGREFVMKDSYSFDVDDDGLAAAYQAHRGAYERTFQRLGLSYRIVSAVSGAMGGSASEEFLAPSPSGEDTFASCSSCGYAANTEAVVLGAGAPAGVGEPPGAQVLDTPDTPTIAALAARLGVDASATLKNVVLRWRQPGASAWSLLVVGVPGDRDVDVDRVAGALAPAEVAVAEPEDLAGQPALVKGYIGPRRLRDLGIRYLVDPAVAPGTAWVTGADQVDRHEVGVVRGRDFEPDGEVGAIAVRDGDPCPACGAGLVLERGIELGHVFQLGRKYAKVFGLEVLGADGRPVTVTMGSYGIGVGRAVAAVAEQTHDDRGLLWPRAVAPAGVHLVATGKGDEPYRAGEDLASELVALGVTVLLDDRRGPSAGVKFGDAELIGVPTIVTAGRGLASGVVEVRDRRTDERRDVPLASAASHLASLLGR